MGKWEKRIAQILKLDKNLRFDELARALEKIGYEKYQPKGGSSHYTFRKKNCPPVTLPKHSPMDKVYVEIVRDIVLDFLDEEESES